MKTTQAEYKKYRLYGTIGMVVLFLMGVLVGFILNGADRTNHSIMTKGECVTLAEKIISATRDNQPILIEQLNKVYSENCLDREFEKIKVQVKSPKKTCEKIEQTLLLRLQCSNEELLCMDSWMHVNDAQIYANLSERGCPKNSEKYKELAKQELEIARAINDDNVESRPDESVEIVETYKRLQMQAEAERMIEKAKKLTSPAIDFIIQLEKIINED